MHCHYEHLPEKYDRKNVLGFAEGQLKDQTEIEYQSMREDLKVLDDWCKANDAAAFFTFFQDTVICAYSRAAIYKQKVWGEKDRKKQEDVKDDTKWTVKVFEGALSGAPVILPIFMVIMNHVQIPEIDMKVFLAAVALGAVISVPYGIIKNNRQQKEAAERRIRLAAAAEEEKHKYDETWVRHSLCDARLRLALRKFAIAPGADSYDRLVKDTYGILEQNLDQFAVNMCPNGMAPRESCETEKR